MSVCCLTTRVFIIFAVVIWTSIALIDLNSLLVQVISSFTASLCFNGALNVDVTELWTYLDYQLRTNYLSGEGSHLVLSVADVTLIEVASMMATKAREDHAVLDKDFEEVVVRLLEA